MRKSICVVICLALLVPALAVVASASAVYSFYLYEPVALYDSGFDFSALPEDASMYVYEGVFPAGKYTFTISGSYYGTDMTIVSKGASFYPGGNFEGSAPIAVYAGGNYRYDYDLPYALHSFDDYTVLVVDFSAFGQVNNTVYPFVEFVAVPDLSLSSYLNVDSFNGILDYVIALVPVTFGVIVGYIGLRKAIAWLQSVLRGA